MNWLIFFILLLVFLPFLHLGLVFLVIFVVINILLIVGEVVFRLFFRKKQPFGFSQRQPRRPKPRASPSRKYDDVQDAEFREEK